MFFAWRYQFVLFEGHDVREEQAAERKRQQMAELEEKIEEQRAAVEPVIEAGVERVKAGRHDPLDVESRFVERKAAEAGLSAEAYVERVAGELEGEEWVLASELKSTGDRRVTFDLERFEEAGVDAAIREVGQTATDGGSD